MTMQPELRRCAAVRCKTQIERNYLMCSFHWERVPPDLRAVVDSSLRAWRAGGSQKPYMLSVCRAQLFIVEAEGLPYVASIKDSIAALEARTEA
jgi:hypothetical protein